VVRPNVAEFHADYGDERRAFNAVAAVDALAAHMYLWCQANNRAAIHGVADDSSYRAGLAQQDAKFGLLRDIAKAQKHVRLTRNPPPVANASQMNARTPGYGEGRYGEGRYGGVLQVVVDISGNDFAYIENVMDVALAFLEGKMQQLGM